MDPYEFEDRSTLLKMKRKRNGRVDNTVCLIKTTSSKQSIRMTLNTIMDRHMAYHRVLYPFLTSSQIKGITLKYLGLPSFMGDFPKMTGKRQKSNWLLSSKLEVNSLAMFNFSKLLRQFVSKCQQLPGRLSGVSSPFTIPSLSGCSSSPKDLSFSESHISDVVSPSSDDDIEDHDWQPAGKKLKTSLKVTENVVSSKTQCREGTQQVVYTSSITYNKETTFYGDFSDDSSDMASVVTKLPSKSRVKRKTTCKPSTTKTPNMTAAQELGAEKLRDVEAEPNGEGRGSNNSLIGSANITRVQRKSLAEVHEIITSDFSDHEPDQSKKRKCPQDEAEGGTSAKKQTTKSVTQSKKPNKKCTVVRRSPRLSKQEIQNTIFAHDGTDHATSEEEQRVAQTPAQTEVPPVLDVAKPKKVPKVTTNAASKSKQKNSLPKMTARKSLNIALGLNAKNKETQANGVNTSADKIVHVDAVQEQNIAQINELCNNGSDDELQNTKSFDDAVQLFATPLLGSSSSVPQESTSILRACGIDVGSDMECDVSLPEPLGFVSIDTSCHDVSPSEIRKHGGFDLTQEENRMEKNCQPSELEDNTDQPPSAVDVSHENIGKVSVGIVPSTCPVLDRQKSCDSNESQLETDKCLVSGDLDTSVASEQSSFVLMTYQHDVDDYSSASASESDKNLPQGRGESRLKSSIGTRTPLTPAIENNGKSSLDKTKLCKVSNGVKISSKPLKVSMSTNSQLSESQNTENIKKFETSNKTKLKASRKISEGIRNSKKFVLQPENEASVGHTKSYKHKVSAGLKIIADGTEADTEATSDNLSPQLPYARARNDSSSPNSEDLIQARVRELRARLDMSGTLGSSNSTESSTIQISITPKSTVQIIENSDDEGGNEIAETTDEEAFEMESLFSKKTTKSTLRAAPKSVCSEMTCPDSLVYHQHKTRRSLKSRTPRIPLNLPHINPTAKVNRYLSRMSRDSNSQDTYLSSSDIDTSFEYHKVGKEMGKKESHAPSVSSVRSLLANLFDPIEEAGSTSPSVNGTPILYSDALTSAIAETIKPPSSVKHAASCKKK